jgi:hypothetical protein
VTQVDLEDFLSDCIADSMDVDWTSRDGAIMVTHRLENAGLLEKVLSALPDYTDSVWDAMNVSE